MEYISPTSQSQNVNPGLINQQLIHRGGANVNLVLHHFITLMGSPESTGSRPSNWGGAHAIFESFCPKKKHEKALPGIG
jgi:hypothetical protein